MSSTEDNPLDVARGDRAISSHLRSSMRLLAERSQDAEFKAAIADVLAGKRSLRDMASSASFDRVLIPLVSSFAERYRELSEADRAAMAAEGDRKLDELRRTQSRPAQHIAAEELEEDGFMVRGVLSSDW